MKNTPAANTPDTYVQLSLDALSRIEKKLEALEKREKRRRFAGVIAIVLVLALLAGAAAYAMPKFRALEENYYAALTVVEEAGAALDELELEKLSSTVDFLSGIDYDAFKESLSLVTEMDVQSILDSLEDVNILIGKMSGLDLEGITDSLNRLNELISPLLERLKVWGIGK